VNTVHTKPILLCYDRSEGARHAIRVTADLFPGHKAVVLHVWSPIALIAAAYGGAISIPSYEDAELQRAAEQLAEEGSRIATEAGLDAKAEAAEMDFNGTWHAILAGADRHDADLIVAGARGLSAFKSFVLGSVSHSIAQHSRRPVLIVPPSAPVGESAALADATASTA
jgi:nucleotide-binding universal stress UspA family protein